jgi:hypothetical protein
MGAATVGRMEWTAFTGLMVAAQRDNIKVKKSSWKTRWLSWTKRTCLALGVCARRRVANDDDDEDDEHDVDGVVKALVDDAQMALAKSKVLEKHV